MAQAYPHVITARLKAHIEPMDRGEWYEDPLSEILEKNQMGKVTGGGSTLGDDFKIVHADLEIALVNLGTALQFTRDSLEKIGVPVGSELIYEMDGEVKSIPFGNRETISIYLDGVGLPDEVYENADFDRIVSEISDAVKSPGAGEFRRAKPKQGCTYMHQAQMQLMQPCKVLLPNTRFSTMPGWY